MSRGLHFVVVVQDVDRLAVLDLLGTLLQLQLQQSVRDYADSDVDGPNVVLYRGDGLLDLRQGCAVAERLAGVVDLVSSPLQLIVHLCQLSLQILHVLRHGLVRLLGLFKVL